MSFILPIKLIVMRILAFLIFFPKMNDQGWNPVSLKTQADAGSSGEWWTWDRHLFPTSPKIPYLMQILHLGTYSCGTMWWCEFQCGLFTAVGWSRFLLMRLKLLLSCLCFPVTWGCWAEATTGISIGTRVTSPDCSTGVTFVLRNKCVTYVWHTYQVFKLLP